MIYRYLVFAVLIMLFGCGGMTSDQEDPAVKSSYPQVLQENKIPVQVLKVVNKTGKEKYDSLCNYLHIKTAQTLGDTDRYAVVSDDLIASSSQQGLSITDSEPEAAILVEITKVLEYNGGTFRFAIFSTQQKRAEVVLRVRKKSLKSHAEIERTGKGSSTKGAWGVLTAVDRDAMLRGEKIWELDNSMIGIAASRAIREVILKSDF